MDDVEQVRVRDMVPGDRIIFPTPSGDHVATVALVVRHPFYITLALVLSKDSHGEWHHDALFWQQVLPVKICSEDERWENLRWAFRLYRSEAVPDYSAIYTNDREGNKGV